MTPEQQAEIQKAIKKLIRGKIGYAKRHNWSPDRLADELAIFVLALIRDIVPEIMVQPDDAPT